MGLTKRTYVKGLTTITADNLNDIQDSILELERKMAEEENETPEPGIVSVEIREV